MGKVFLSDEDDPIDIRLDGIFKAVFTKQTPDSTGALSSLVSALVGRKLTVISILANEPPINDLRDRQIRYDINCRAEGGELVNVEMCLHPDTFEPLRLEYYLARLYSSQDIRGVDSGYEDLHWTYQIAILSNTKVINDDRYFHTFFYYDPLGRVSLEGRTQIITLELSKLTEIVDKPIGQMTSSERWAVFMEYRTDRSKRDIISEIVQYEEGIAMASKVLLNITKEDHEKARQLSKLKYELD
ncbi:MAG: Rpn family recombination-promoting nuclease/putative transposase, partial [Treponema sp.]|nr:Rpn family recombination-promoting nuclease/putative transposase [Treponema sp.]